MQGAGHRELRSHVCLGEETSHFQKQKKQQGDLNSLLEDYKRFILDPLRHGASTMLYDVLLTFNG